MEKAAERFRLQTLQSRYNAFAELWDKRMQAREEGRTGPIHRVVHVVPPAASPSAPDAASAGKGAAKKAAPPRSPTSRPSWPRPKERSAGAPLRRTSPLAPTPRRPSSVKPRNRVDFTPLFQRYVAARQALGEDVSRLRYEKFEESVRRQADEIRKKTGSSRLVFEVQTTDGRVRLVGRPAAPGRRGDDALSVAEGAPPGRDPRGVPRRLSRGREGLLQGVPRSCDPSPRRDPRHPLEDRKGPGGRRALQRPRLPRGLGRLLA